MARVMTVQVRKEKFRMLPIYITGDDIKELKDLKENFEFVKEYPNFIQFRHKRHGYYTCVNITHYDHLMQMTDEMIQEAKVVKNQTLVWK